MMPRREELLSALMLTAVALFLASNHALAGRWRRHVQRAAIIVFGVAVLAALVAIGQWLAAG